MNIMKSATFKPSILGTACLSALLLAGCQSAPSPMPEGSHQPVWVAKDLGLKQCEQTSAKTALKNTESVLSQKQVQVLAAHCADDGMMRVQVCGASQGKLGIYKIAAFQLKTAQSLGFKEVKDSQYQSLNCS